MSIDGSIQPINPEVYWLRSRLHSERGLSRPSEITMDRFIRPINHDIYWLKQRIHSEHEVLTPSKVAYRDRLCEALVGVPFSKARSLSVFSPPIIHKTSLFDQSPWHEQREPLRTITLYSITPTKILDAPGLKETFERPSRVVVPLGNDSYMVACSGGIHNVDFSGEKSYKVRELYNTQLIPTLSYITVIDPNTPSPSFVASDTNGQLYHLHGGDTADTIRKGEVNDPIIDLVVRDPSTFLFGNQKKGVSLADFRGKKLTVINFSGELTCFALSPDSLSLATGSNDSIAIFDIRSSRGPARTRYMNNPVTAIAWQTNESTKTLFAATGGNSPCLIAHDQSNTLYPLCMAKTEGIVRSILCSARDGAIITPRIKSSGDSVVVWKYEQSLRSSLRCTQIGNIPPLRQGESRGNNPSCGAIGKGDESFIVAYPEDELFGYWKLVPPPAKKLEKPSFSYYLGMEIR
jgi:WD40 repeat protein